jgi:fatty-acid desaturase
MRLPRWSRPPTSSIRVSRQVALTSITAFRALEARHLVEIIMIAAFSLAHQIAARDWFAATVTALQLVEYVVWLVDGLGHGIGSVKSEIAS